MDPALLLTLLVPILLLIVVGVVVGLLLARGARREAARTRALLDEALARRATEAAEAASTASAGSAPAAPGAESEALGAVRDEVRTLRARLEEQGRRADAQADAQAERLERLGEELRALAEVPEPPPPVEEEPPEPPSAREIVLAYALAEGLENVHLLQDPADPESFVLEAQSRGMPFKGRVYVRPGGRIEADLAPGFRAFP